MSSIVNRSKRMLAKKKKVVWGLSAERSQIISDPNYKSSEKESCSKGSQGRKGF